MTSASVVPVFSRHPEGGKRSALGTSDAPAELWTPDQVRGDV